MHLSRQGTRSQRGTRRVKARFRQPKNTSNSVQHYLLGHTRRSHQSKKDPLAQPCQVNHPKQTLSKHRSSDWTLANLSRENFGQVTPRKAFTMEVGPKKPNQRFLARWTHKTNTNQWRLIIFTRSKEGFVAHLLHTGVPVRFFQIIQVQVKFSKVTKN